MDDYATQAYGTSDSLLIQSKVEHDPVENGDYIFHVSIHSLLIL